MINELYIFIPIAIVLLYLTIKPRKSYGWPDTSGLANIFWGIVLITFTLVWGGIFWW